MKVSSLIVVSFLATPAFSSAEMWHLKNSGFSFQREISDIESRTIQSVPGVDLDLPRLEKVNLKKTPVVAIIDYGIDTSHPQLKNQFYLNETECVNGEAPLSPQEDKDGNGLKGDCKGWNFTAGEGRGARVLDESGHGTHLAGIIAGLENEIGYRGIDSRIKILPLQVLRKSQSTTDLGLKPDWVAAAVRYAIARKVDVINFSLGWPEFMNTQDVKSAIDEAIAAGIVVVAAAGNNSHEVPIFPCAFAEVLCVGSISADGFISPFSNRGLHVDVLAPGEQILGTFPLNREPEFSSFQGYEVKSGTSQAAPMVSALAALLKAQDPTRNVKNVRELIMNGSRSLQGFNTVSAGLVSFKNSLSAENLTQSWVRVKGSQLRSLEHSVIRVPAEVHFGSPGQRLEVTDSRGHYLSFTKLGGKNIEILFPIQSEDLDHRQTLKFSIKGTGAERSEVAKSAAVKIYKDVERPAKAYTVPRDVRSLPVAPSFKDGESKYSLQENQSFHFWRWNKSEGKDLVLEFLRLGGEGSVTTESLILPQAVQVLWARERDLNLDRQREIEVLYVSEIDGKKEVRWLFLDSKAQGLFGSLQASSFAVQSEEFLPPFEVKAVRQTEVQGQVLRLPLFIAQSRLPSLDEVGAFDPDQRRSRQRVLSYRMDQKRLVPTSLDRLTEIQDFKQKLGLRGQDTVNVLSASGQGLIRVSVGRSFERQLVEMDLSEVSSWAVAPHKILKTDFALDGFLDLDSQWLGRSSIQTWIWGWFSQDQFRWKKLSPTSESESWIQVLGSLSGRDEQTLLLQSTTELHLIKSTAQGDLTQDHTPFEVTSFLADEVFGSQSFPFVGQRAGREYLALYSDASLMVGPQVSLMLEQNGKMRAPIRLSLKIPAGCRSLNPRVIDAKLTYVFQCSEGSEHQKSTKLFTYQIESED